jgi:hypothetical protein
MCAWSECVWVCVPLRRGEGARSGGRGGAWQLRAAQHRQHAVRERAEARLLHRSLERLRARGGAAARRVSAQHVRAT